MNFEVFQIQIHKLFVPKLSLTQDLKKKVLIRMSVADSATTAETNSSMKVNSIQELSTDLLRVYYGK